MPTDPVGAAAAPVEAVLLGVTLGEVAELSWGCVEMGTVAVAVVTDPVAGSVLVGVPVAVPVSEPTGVFVVASVPGVRVSVPAVPVPTGGVGVAEVSVRRPPDSGPVGTMATEVEEPPRPPPYPGGVSVPEGVREPRVTVTVKVPEGGGMTTVSEAVTVTVGLELQEQSTMSSFLTTSREAWERFRLVFDTYVEGLVDAF
jgi:hypothetical protein